MKHGRFILSAAALVFTVAGMFAFKGTKLTGGIQCYTTVVNGAGNRHAVSGCKTLNGHSQGTTRCGVGTANLYTNSGTSVSYCTKAN